MSSFPWTRVLDRFARADASSIGGHWSQMHAGGAPDLGISSNQAYNPDGSWQAMYYDRRTYGPDVEVYVTLATLQPQTNTVVLYARVQDPAPSTYDGYAAYAYRFDNGGTDTMRLSIRRFDDASATTLGATLDVTGIGNGDQLGLRVRGSTLELWYNTGSGWTLQIERTDSTYPQAGYLAMAIADTTARLDDFGGGDVGGEAVGGYARVLVGDRTGRVLAELEPQIESCAWRLNGVGRMTLTMARVDALATEENLRWGNRILVQFGNGLPDWGGVLDRSRKWTPEGGIVCEAYSGEQILGWRRTGKDREFSGVTVGTVYQTLIADANAERDMGIAVGSVYAGGEAFSPAFHYENVLDVVQEQLIEHALSTFDFYVEAGLSGGVIGFTAHFYERRGADRPGVALIEDRNAVLPELLEQGPIVNDWAVLGAGSTWGDERSSAVEQDNLSIAAYDLRQGVASHTETTSSAAAAAIAANLLNESAQPRNRVGLGALDVAPAAFSQYDVGDAIQVTLPSFGFSGYDHLCRVLTREYDFDSGMCDLVVEEWD